MQSSVHRILSTTEKRIPTPLSIALYGTKPNEAVHADFLYMEVAGDCYWKYVLLLMDDISLYSWLFPCASADSDATTNAVPESIAHHSCLEFLVTDRGAHFSALLIMNLTKDANINHYFTTPYCSWANGMGERFCREVLRTAHALLSKGKLPVTCWPSIIYPIQKIIN